jgi:hypothetical protein
MAGRDVSDEELENVRHELEFCVNQTNDLLPSVLRIGMDRLKADNFASNLVNAMETAQWNVQFRDLLLKIMLAQAKYIKLLERRIGK